MNASDHVAQARARKMADALALGINEAFISHLVEHFYEAIRADEMLGPIFGAKVSDWPHHLARMKDFWASIMLESGRFSGNPMRVGSLYGMRHSLRLRRTSKLRTGFATRRSESAKAC